MAKENISQEFRLKNIDETKNYFIEEIHKWLYQPLIYFSYYAYWMYVPLVGISLGIASSAVGIKICKKTAIIGSCKSIIRKKKHDKVILLTKTTLNTVKTSISKVLIGSCISHDEFFLVNNVLKEFNDMVEEIKSPKTSSVNQGFLI